MRGYLVEGLERVTEALAQPHAVEHPDSRADALSAAAGLAYWLADSGRAKGFYAQEIELRRELGDRPGLAEALYGMSFTWSIIDLERDDAIDQARGFISDALAIYEELQDAPGIARCEWALANVAWSARDVEGARVHAARALELFTEVGDRFNQGWASYTLGLAALGELDREVTTTQLEEARRRFSEALAIFDDAQDVTGYALVLDGLAMLALHQGDRVRAARLSGAVETLERTSGTGLNIWNRGVLRFDPEALRQDPALADAWAEGAALTRDEAAAYARSI
jgi:tetratricopeptide (TPR) repeat protein